MGFGSGGSGSSSISTASDSALNNPVNNEVFTFDATSSKWKNAAVPSVSQVAISAQTATYTLVLADAGKAVEVDSAGVANMIVPPNSSVAFPIGTVIEVAWLGAGAVTLSAGVGVTLQSADGALSLRARYSVASLRKRASDIWLVAGDLA